MRLDPAGLPFIGGALAARARVRRALGWVLRVPFVVLGAFFVVLLPRSRARVAADRSGDARAVAGRRPRAGRRAGRRRGAAPPGEWQQISIFLSPMDVHVNRIPASGRVTQVSYTPGRFLPAYRHDAAAVNERSEIWIDHGGQTIVARQIVGILARRVVCRAEVGAEVRAGDRFGIMKFGSRMDVFLPLSADDSASTWARWSAAGETVIAVLH